MSDKCIYGRWVKNKFGIYKCPYPQCNCTKNNNIGICCRTCDDYNSCVNHCLNQPKLCGKLKDF